MQRKRCYLKTNLRERFSNDSLISFSGRNIKFRLESPKLFLHCKQIYLYFEPMKKNTPLSLLLIIIIFSSCSVSNKISRGPTKDILNNPAFVNAHTGISIYEPATGKYWYNYQAEKYFNPASNTKLATCYAAMKYLGDSLTGISYAIINDSTVVVKGMADPSFLHSDYNNNPVFYFLRKYKYIQLIKPQFDDYLGSGWAWDDYPYYYMAQRSAFPIYGNTLKISWDNDGSLTFLPSYFKNQAVINENLTEGFKVIKPWDTNDFTFENGNSKFQENPYLTTLVQLLQDTLHADVEIIDNYAGSLKNVIHSQQTDSLLKPMMHRSDNFYAEQSLLMVSEKLLGVMNYKEIIDTLLKTDYQLMPQKPEWVDGSGLSRYDLFSPKDFVFILNKMKNDFGMDRIKNILPTGGTGTSSHYYKQDSGYIFVKTGTLNGVVALSGFLYTKKNKLLIFSVLVNHHRSSATEIREGIEKFIQQIRDNY
jgi:D-alanyl-D-alanine carboxypeptidase/D-alanyl-D-alanine-endopeptidase (penicillin-binding protein 4)